MKIGIIGLPNVGKTTFFNALSQTHAAAENYPFCTIEPNIGSVQVPDERLQKIAEIIKPKKVVHATVEFVDIAGLVKNAHEGEGLGNKFLSHIRETDAIAHVVRCFEKENVSHVHGTSSPSEDIEIVDLELVLADLQTLEKRLNKVTRVAHSGAKEAKREEAFLNELKPALEKGIPLRRHFKKHPPVKEVLPILNEIKFMTSKPVMYIANVGDTIDEKTKAALKIIGMYAEPDGAEILPVAAEIESELAELEPEERQQFISELGFEIHGLDELIQAGYRLLDFVSFYTIVSDETRAWAVTRGTHAPQAAGKIHSDMEEGFIRADVVQFNDLVETGSFAHAREAGALKSEGKNYVVQDGDVIYFHFKK